MKKNNSRLFVLTLLIVPVVTGTSGFGGGVLSDALADDGRVVRRH